MEEGQDSAGGGREWGRAFRAEGSAPAMGGRGAVSLRQRTGRSRGDGVEVGDGWEGLAGSAKASRLLSWGEGVGATKGT